MKERDIRVVFSMITGLLAEIAALFSGYSKGKARKSRLSVGDSLPDAPHAPKAQFMTVRSIHARKRCSFTTPPSRFASTPPLAQGRQEPYLRPAAP